MGTNGTIKEKVMRRRVSITALVFIFAALTAHAADNMKAFPPPGKGMVRYVLQLPNRES